MKSRERFRDRQREGYRVRRIGIQRKAKRSIESGGEKDSEGQTEVEGERYSQ